MKTQRHLIERIKKELKEQERPMAQWITGWAQGPVNF